MIEKLETLRTSLQLTLGKSEDFRDGQIEALGFCIRKHKEDWNINDFIKDLDETLNGFKNPYDDYEKGIIDALKFNIENMEVVTNE